jgi:hypothetical protein
MASSLLPKFFNLPLSLQPIVLGFLAVSDIQSLDEAIRNSSSSLEDVFRAAILHMRYFSLSQFSSGMWGEKLQAHIQWCDDFGLDLRAIKIHNADHETLKMIQNTYTDLKALELRPVTEMALDVISDAAGTLETLVLSSMKLTMTTEDPFILFASVGQCSTLKQLSITDMISDHWNLRVAVPQQYLIYLLTNCPLLESLTLELCFSDIDALTPSDMSAITCPNLKLLNITSYGFPIDSFIALVNVCPVLNKCRLLAAERGEFEGIDVNIESPLRGYIYDEYVSLVMDSCKELQVGDVTQDQWMPLMKRCRRELLTLKVNHCYPDDFDDQVETSITIITDIIQLPKFRNLIDLYFQCYNCIMATIETVLQACPLLRGLHIHSPLELDSVAVGASFLPRTPHLRCLTLISTTVYASAVPALAAALPSIGVITLFRCTIKTDMCCAVDAFPSLFSDDTSVSRPKPASSLHTLDVSTSRINNLECIDAILRECAGVKTLWVGSRSVGRCSEGLVNGSLLYPMLSKESLQALRVLCIRNNKPMMLRCAELIMGLLVSCTQHRSQTAVVLVDMVVVGGKNGLRVVSNDSYVSDDDDDYEYGSEDGSIFGDNGYDDFEDDYDYYFPYGLSSHNVDDEEDIEIDLYKKHPSIFRPTGRKNMYYFEVL